MKKLIAFAIPFTAIAATMGYFLATGYNLWAGLALGIVPPVALGVWGTSRMKATRMK